MATSQTSPFFCRTPIIVKYTMYRKPFLYQPHCSKFPSIIVFNIKYHKPWNAVIQWHVPDWHIPCIITVDEGYSERTWWRLFWAYMMKVILSVPDEGYSESTWWRLFWAYLMKVILSVPDEGNSICKYKFALIWIRINNGVF
jgi:hypothetical protein